MIPPKLKIKGYFPGGSYKSHKMWEKLQTSGGKGFLTVLTREFLWEDVRRGGDGHDRIVESDVNSNSYNVPFHNAKLEGLHNRKEIIVAKLGGKLEQF